MCVCVCVCVCVCSPPGLTSMRSQHGGEGRPHVAAGEHRSDVRVEKTQHPPTQTHTSLLLRHHSRASTKLSASPSLSPTSPPSSPSLSCLPPPSLSLSRSLSLYESEGSLHHLLQDAANHLRVRACVFERGGEKNK